MSSERDVITGIVQLANLLTRRIAPIFAKAQVTPQQWLVLSAIAASDGPTSLVALAKRLLVTKQNMTGMIARLEEQGLVERTDDPVDLRSWRVVLSRRGKGLVERVRPAYEQWLKTLGSDLPERDMQTLERTVNRLIEQLETSQD